MEIAKAFDDNMGHDSEWFTLEISYKEKINLERTSKIIQIYLLNSNCINIRTDKLLDQWVELRFCVIATKMSKDLVVMKFDTTQKFPLTCY